MKLYVKESNDYLFELANVRGKTVKVPNKLDFSFAFTTKDCTEGKDLYHGFRVKPVFNPEKINADELGTLKMFDDYEYVPGKNDRDIKEKKIKSMKEFFIDYKILFAAVWEKVLPQDTLQDYFKGHITLEELIQEFYFYDEYEDILSEITSLDELRNVVEENNLFNTWEM